MHQKKYSLQAGRIYLVDTIASRASIVVDDQSSAALVSIRVYARLLLPRAQITL